MKINDVNQYFIGFKTIRYITEEDDSKKNACFLQDTINKINTVLTPITNYNYNYNSNNKYLNNHSIDGDMKKKMNVL